MAPAPACGDCWRGLGRWRAAVPGLRAPSVAVLGDFIVDVQAAVPSLPRWDADVETTGVEVLPGGSAANTARQLAALRRGVLFFGTCGADLLGDAALAALRAQRFCVKHIHRLPAASSVCIVLSGPADRAFVTSYSTVHQLTCAQLDARALRACRHIHVGGYFGLRGLQTEEFTSLLRNCHANGATISLSPQFDPTERWTGENAHLSHILKLLDILIANEGEHAAIQRALGAPLHELAPALAVVVTCGKAGARVFPPGGLSPTLEIPAHDVEVVDSCGAGDAFTAGFLAQWLERPDDLGGAAVFANAVAACSVRRIGACAKPVPAHEAAQLAVRSLSGASTSKS